MFEKGPKTAGKQKFGNNDENPIAFDEIQKNRNKAIQRRYI